MSIPRRKRRNNDIELPIIKEKVEHRSVFRDLVGEFKHKLCYIPNSEPSALFDSVRW